MSAQEILDRTGPRKLLALDGGGMRGMITVEVLAKIEEILRKKHGDHKSFVVADYFDYIAGTSTGAMVAACLSLRMLIARIRESYEKRGEELFSEAC